MPLTIAEEQYYSRVSPAYKVIQNGYKLMTISCIYSEESFVFSGASEALLLHSYVFRNIQTPLRQFE